MTNINSQSAFSSAVIINFGQEGNCADHILSGWSGPEDGHRWTLGRQSFLTFPPVLFDGDGLAVMTLLPFDSEDQFFQTITVFLNDFRLDTFRLRAGVGTYAVPLPADCLKRTAGNKMTFHQPNARRPSDHGHGDTRELGVSFRHLIIEPNVANQISGPKLIPHFDFDHDNSQTPKEIFADFQSLGQNCEFGLVQRQAGIEPLGLLRFASISLPKLVRGLETEFDGIGAPENFKLSIDHGGDYMGHHSIYGLDYHTFKKSTAFDHKQLQESELRRLPFLARLLIEDIIEARKIFVLLRRDMSLTSRETQPVFRLLRRYNPDACLLWITPASEISSVMAGRVEITCKGFYHGFIDRLSPDGNVANVSFDCWTDICAATRKHWIENRA